MSYYLYIVDESRPNGFTEKEVREALDLIAPTGLIFEPYDRGLSIVNPECGDTPLFFEHGRLLMKTPSIAAANFAISLAPKLGAIVKGDEGEIYTEPIDDTDYKEEKVDAASVFKIKKLVIIALVVIISIIWQAFIKR